MLNATTKKTAYSVNDSDFLPRHLVGWTMVLAVVVGSATCQASEFGYSYYSTFGQGIALNDNGWVLGEPQSPFEDQYYSQDLWIDENGNDVFSAGWQPFIGNAPEGIQINDRTIFTVDVHEINNLNQAVGIGNGGLPLIWQHPAIAPKLLEIPTDSYTVMVSGQQVDMNGWLGNTPTAINDKGQIVGEGRSAGKLIDNNVNQIGALWWNPDLSGASFTRSWALDVRDVNESGAVAGHLDYRPAIWAEPFFEDPQFLCDCKGSVTAINDRGDAVGNLFDIEELPGDDLTLIQIRESDPVVWMNGQMTILEGWQKAYGINNAGVVVGSRILNDGTTDGVIWSNEVGTRSLSDLVGFRVGAAKAINSQGQILAGGPGGDFVFTPNEPPDAIVHFDFFHPSPLELATKESEGLVPHLVGPGQGDKLPVSRLAAVATEGSSEAEQAAAARAMESRNAIVDEFESYFAQAGLDVLVIRSMDEVNDPSVVEHIVHFSTRQEGLFGIAETVDRFNLQLDSVLNDGKQRAVVWTSHPNSGEELSSEEIGYVAAHEIGHLFGLIHHEELDFRIDELGNVITNSSGDPDLTEFLMTAGGVGEFKERARIVDIPVEQFQSDQGNGPTSNPTYNLQSFVDNQRFSLLEAGTRDTPTEKQQKRLKQIGDDRAVVLRNVTFLTGDSPLMAASDDVLDVGVLDSFDSWLLQEGASLELSVWPDELVGLIAQSEGSERYDIVLESTDGSYLHDPSDETSNLLLRRYLSDGESEILGALIFESAVVDFEFDLNQDGLLTWDDMRFVTMVEERDFLLDYFATRMGDTNGDMKVDFTDFLTLSTNFGDPTKRLYTDGNFDLVDDGPAFGDFLVLASNYGFSSQHKSEVVPEPTSHWLPLPLGAVAMMRRRRRSAIRLRPIHLPKTTGNSC